MNPSHPKNIEIKVTVDGRLVAEAIDAFDLDPAAAQARSIWFCESAAGLHHQRLDLLDRGIILRMRAGAFDSSDATVKLRGSQPPQLSSTWQDKFEVEGDWSGEQKMISASLTAKIKAGVIESAVAEGGCLQDVFAGLQTRYLSEECEPPVAPAELRALGPIAALKWKAFSVDGLSSDVRAEQWAVDDLLFLEFSLRVKFRDAKDAQQELRQVIADHGIKIGNQQAPKTSLVLRHLAETSGDTVAGAR